MTNLKWVKEENNYYLKNDDDSLLKLNITSAIVADFILNEKKFEIRKKGAWNPSYYVTTNGKEIIKLTHSFWGSKGKLSCWDGTVYKCEYINKGGLKVRFLAEENELLSYYLLFESNHQSINFNLGTSLEDAEKLLVLVALGMVLFTSLTGELFSKNDDTSTFLLLVAAS